MEKINARDFHTIYSDIKQLIGAKINQTTVINSRCFLFSFSMIKNEQLFISLEHQKSYISLIGKVVSISTVVCQTNDILRKFIRDSYIVDIEQINNDRIFKFTLQKANELCEVKHNIKIQKNTLMSKMFPNNETMGVNSWHHQAIHRLAEDFVIDAYADDGKIIEAMHHKADDQWIFAVQFHPEQFMKCGNNAFLKIFTEFVDQAIKKRDKK